jgi:dUTP pyrophosphatase
LFKVKRLTESAKLPTVVHPGMDLGYDIYADEDVVLYRGMPLRISTGIAIEFPTRIGGLIMDRSSMGLNGLKVLGGVIDSGYRGEIFVTLVNVNAPNYNVDPMFALFGSPRITRDMGGFYKISKGDKIAQLVPTFAYTHHEILEVTELAPSERGTKGFGSSGK